MNAFELYHANGTPTGVFACGECRSIIPPGDEPSAEACCRPKKCKLCGEDITEKGYWLHHPECWNEYHRKEAAERLAAAEKVESWDGFVFTDLINANDGYFSNLGELVEWLEDKGTPPEQWPEYVHITRSQSFGPLTVDGVLDGPLGDAYEDAYDALNGLDELGAALKAFNEANKHVLTYFPDYARAVRVPRA